MEKMIKTIDTFFKKVEEREIEIYNEISLQHELGIYLRVVMQKFKVQFERPVNFFNLKRADFNKKEIDICIYDDVKKPHMAIELKFPRQGQHPEQMFKACTDISFLEQLKSALFAYAFFIIVVDDPRFYKGRETDGIYSFFRSGAPINGRIKKPTGQKDIWISISNKYQVQWKRLKNGISYWQTEVY